MSPEMWPEIAVAIAAVYAAIVVIAAAVVVDRANDAATCVLRSLLVAADEVLRCPFQLVIEFNQICPVKIVQFE